MSRPETGERLALVVATHAHQDHISGFAACESFLKFKVGEVWMPWTENPHDSTAVRLKNKQAALTETVAQHLAAKPPSDDVKLALDGALQNLRGNAEALRLLKAGITGGVVRYLEAGQTIEKAAGIPGLSMEFIGPPRDGELPGAHGPSYRRAVSPRGGGRFAGSGERSHSL